MEVSLSDTLVKDSRGGSLSLLSHFIMMPAGSLRILSMVSTLLRAFTRKQKSAFKRLILETVTRNDG